MYRSTPLERALATTLQEQNVLVCKLFKLLMLAKEELPCAKYTAVLELEKRHSNT